MQGWDCHIKGSGSFEGDKEALRGSGPGEPGFIELGMPSLWRPTIKVAVTTEVAISHSYQLGMSPEDDRFEEPCGHGLYSYETAVEGREIFDPLSESKEFEQERARQVDLGHLQVVTSVPWIDSMGKLLAKTQGLAREVSRLKRVRLAKEVIQLRGYLKRAREKTGMHLGMPSKRSKFGHVW